MDDTKRILVKVTNPFFDMQTTLAMLWKYAVVPEKYQHIQRTTNIANAYVFAEEALEYNLYVDSIGSIQIKIDFTNYPFLDLTEYFELHPGTNINFLFGVNTV